MGKFKQMLKLHAFSNTDIYIVLIYCISKLFCSNPQQFYNSVCFASRNVMGFSSFLCQFCEVSILIAHTSCELIDVCS